MLIQPNIWVKCLTDEQSELEHAFGPGTECHPSTWRARGMDAEQNGHLGRVSLAAVGAPRLNLHSRFTDDGNGRFNS
jgi:hypothetical protein